MSPAVPGTFVGSSRRSRAPSQACPLGRSAALERPGGNGHARPCPSRKQGDGWRVHSSELLFPTLLSFPTRDSARQPENDGVASVGADRRAPREKPWILYRGWRKDASRVTIVDDSFAGRFTGPVSGAPIGERARWSDGRSSERMAQREKLSKSVRGAACCVRGGVTRYRSIVVGPTVSRCLKSRYVFYLKVYGIVD